MQRSDSIVVQKAVGKRPEALRTRVVLLGPPASGKGTQAERIRGAYGIETTSSGEMLREEARKGSALGLEADRLTAQGQLAPDAMILQLVEAWLSSARERFVFDGFPRTLPQGEALEGLLERLGKPLDAVLFFNLPESVIADRVLNRVNCSQCGGIFSTGEVEAACPNCGGPLFRRKDDTLEALSRRLEAYHAKTEPLVDFYRERGKLFVLDAAQEPDAVFHDITNVLEGR